MMMEKVKKDASSRFQASGFKAQVKEPKPTLTQVSAAGEYTMDKLRQMRSSQRSFPTAAAKPAQAPETAAAPAEPAFKLSGTFKRTDAASDDRFQIRPLAVTAPEEVQASRRAVHEDEDAILPPPSRPPPKAGAGGAAPPIGGTGAGRDSTAAPPTQPQEDSDDEFSIPDAETIRRAKEKRERLRTARLAPDYVPLGGAAALLRKDAPQQEAKTGKQEGGSDSEEEVEEQLRMTFLGPPKGPPPKKGAPGVPKTQQRQALHVGDEEDDEWVREQIRRGARGAASLAPAEPPAPSRPAPPGPGAATSATLAEEISQSGDRVLQALHQAFNRLKASHAQAQKQLGKVTANLRESMKTVATLEGELGKAGDKYTFLQELKAYIADLCDMLQVKSPIVEELEEAMLGLREGRAVAGAERRTAEQEEEYGPSAAAIAAALGVLGRGGASAAAAAAAENAASLAEEKLLEGSSAVELDEFGRDVNVGKRQEAQARAARRKKRLADQQQRQQQQRNLVHQEEWWGEETTEESEGELTHYSARRREILDTSQNVFADAGEEFGSLEGVKNRLEGWKKTHAGAYRDAYMPLSAPAVFAPFVRLELLAWEPLFEGQSGFDNQKWYQSLFDYGTAGGSLQLEPGDADEDLIPRLVKELVLPVARHAVRACWNPFSRRQSAAVHDLIKDLLVYIPADDSRLQELLGDVQARLKEAVAKVHVPQWPVEATSASPRAHATQARLFGKAVRLVRNVAGFEGTLAPRRPDPACTGTGAGRAGAPVPTPGRGPAKSGAGTDRTGGGSSARGLVSSGGPGPQGSRRPPAAAGGHRARPPGGTVRYRWGPAGPGSAPRPTLEKAGGL
eukprot:jgi/Botrbrau1/3210/Bobra.37_2s0040.1